MTIAPHSMASRLPDFTGKLIDEGRFELVRLLGAGGGGVVYLAIDHRAPTSSSGASPARCAIKIVRKLEGPALDCQKREIATHDLVSDIPHVLPLHDAWDDDEYLYIALQHCESDLYRAIFERRAYWRNDELVRSVFLQVLDAVHECHQRGIFHRDLKPENILCNADGSEAYIADFGLATINTRSTTFCCGSLPYLSPESVGLEFSTQAYSTRRSDIWALGVMLVNMITGLCPWEKATSGDPRFCDYLLDDSFLERNLPVSQGVVRILKKLFRIDPRSRPSLEQFRESILAMDSFFPQEEAAFGLPLPAKIGAAHTPKPEEVSVEVVESVSSNPYEDLSMCFSATDNSDLGSESTDESVLATPPDECPVPIDPSELLQEVDRVLRSLKDAPPKPAELNILERLQIHVVD